MLTLVPRNSIETPFPWSSVHWFWPIPSWIASLDIGDGHVDSRTNQNPCSLKPCQTPSEVLIKTIGNELPWFSPTWFADEVTTFESANQKSHRSRHARLQLFLYRTSKANDSTFLLCVSNESNYKALCSIVVQSSLLANQYIGFLQQRIVFNHRSYFQLIVLIIIFVWTALDSMSTVAFNGQLHTLYINLCSNTTSPPYSFIN